MTEDLSLRVESALARMSSALIRAEFDSEQRALWVSMRKPQDQAQTFSWGLLTALRRLIDEVKALQQTGATPALHYIVVASENPSYFSLGGDLEHFLRCIQRGDARALREYSMQCLDMIFGWATELNQHAATISLVQGRALGGGFEAALASDYIVAEEQAQFGLPEILFGLFPVSGALSLLQRRVSLATAEAWMVQAPIHDATFMHQQGVVDQVCPRGQGPGAVQEFIREHAKRRKARMALRHARWRMTPLDYSDMARLVEQWVASALDLTQQELRVLDTLVRMQRSEMAR